ncbi:ribosome small subunit-dependent GTPase A [Solimonas sp. K1W22B-7]|uniref:ribosome small subunit-dependent GTPase A n=1 Tax=Solimonas sp. K1W22B-7 TaxID=2303331 RepID=UPI000E32D8E8|nr:ribosome small subunit-dependent GTPase A [Solimonas sp. K1W22B-7]AXQ30891.1 ribosome small subunit-dependent GTPase A [Solimonas sp. K1W22B-7]
MSFHPFPDALRRIGFPLRLVPFLSSETGALPARVIARHRDRCELHDGSQVFEALFAPGEDPLAGDWALWRDEGGTRRIAALLPRANLLRRGRGDGEAQPLVANVDTALLVMGLDGNYKPNRLERFLLLARASETAAVVVLSKADLCTDADARIAAVRRLCGSATQVVHGDTRDATLRAALQPWLGEGQTLVLLGSSGVGKSTLCNTLLGDSRQATGTVSAAADRGRHTTTARRLLCLPDGACIIDTPGLRELRLSGDEALGNGAFEDIAQLAEHCRYGDCRHEEEPGCAVRGQVDEGRLANYHKLERELAHARQTSLQRQATKRADKALHRSQRRFYRDRDR